MNRRDNDTWDLTTSVGATATMVAAARAVASRQPEPIINDPFAQPLVRAAGIELFARLVDGDLDYAEIGSAWMPEFFGVRAHFFDNFLPSVLSAGIRQAVIVASGLDSRAYRLVWPDGTTVYEIDQPGVIEFKNSVLSGLGAVPTTHLRTVGIDLRQDWPAALQQAGFDSAQPTAWMAEGLMIGYLPSEAQDHLLDQITALSARGSKLIADHLPKRSKSVGSMILSTAKTWTQQGFDVDFGDLTYSHEHNDAEKYLRTRGWHTIGHSLAELLNAAGRSGAGMDLGPNGQGAIRYLIATRD